MRVFFLGKIFSGLCPSAPLRAVSLVIAWVLALFLFGMGSADAVKQESTPALPRIAQDQIDSLALRVSQQIRQEKIDPAFPKVFVIDFNNTSDRQFSRLGSILADDFAESLSSFASGFQVEDRKDFNAYLKENRMGLDDLKN